MFIIHLTPYSLIRYLWFLFWSFPSSGRSHFAPFTLGLALNPPFAQDMGPVKRWEFLWLGSYSSSHWMLTLRTFFIDFINFAKTFAPPSGLFELNLKHFSSWPKMLIKLQNNRISPLHQLWIQVFIAYFYLIPSRLWVPLWKVPYLSFRRMIFLVPGMKYSRLQPPLACSDRIFDIIFSYLSCIRDRGAYWAWNFSLVFYWWVVW